MESTNVMLQVFFLFYQTLWLCCSFHAFCTDREPASTVKAKCMCLVFEHHAEVGEAPYKLEL